MKRKNVPFETAEEIKRKLIELGGEEKKTGSENEVWIVRLSDATFTYYKSGTLYATETRVKDPIVFEAYDVINSIVGQAFIKPSKENVKYLIGFDEVGKGEFLGSMWLAVAVIPVVIFDEIASTVDTVDTKKRRSYEYWQNVLKKLSSIKEKGLFFDYKRIPPWEIDKYNLNDILDISYMHIFNRLPREAGISLKDSEIVFDDYGIGDVLKRFLKYAENLGAKVIYEIRSEENHLSTRVASIIAKAMREREMHYLNESYRLGNIEMGTGAPNDPKSLRWLEEYWKSRKSLPWFVRRSYKPVMKTCGLTQKRKERKTFDVSFISEKYRLSFEQGQLSIDDLKVICSKCGSELNYLYIKAKIDRDAEGKPFSEVKICCPNCDLDLTNIASTTLRNYCGYIVVDNNILGARFLTRELADSRKDARIFEDFTIIIPKGVYFEYSEDNRGKIEIEELKRLHNMGRIRLIVDKPTEEEIEKFRNNTNRRKNVDISVIEYARQYNAIILSGDRGVVGGAHDVFSIRLIVMS